MFNFSVAHKFSCTKQSALLWHVMFLKKIIAHEIFYHYSCSRDERGDPLLLIRCGKIRNRYLSIIAPKLISINLKKYVIQEKQHHQRGKYSLSSLLLPPSSPLILCIGLHWQDSFEAAGCIFLVFSFSFHLEELRVQEFRFEWAVFEGAFKFCLVFSFLLI